MTVKLVGTVHTGAEVLVEGAVCKVRCACGREFAKARTGVLQVRAKGFHLRCWQCKCAAHSETATRQAEKRSMN